jgi:hypothetical protein
MSAFIRGRLTRAMAGRTILTGGTMATPRPRILLAVLNLAGFLAVVVVNALATTVPLGGKTTGQLSDQYPNLFVPSGLTFSIWGVIYILLAIYAVYGIVHSVRRPDHGADFMEGIGVLFLVTCAANAGWILAWQYEVLPLSLVFMVILLVTLIVIYNRLNVGRSTAAPVEKYMVHLPMSVYLGWITIATIANVTALLVSYKWDRFGIPEEIWATVMIGIGIVLGLLILFTRGDIFYSLVVDWALLGILLKRTADTATPAKGVIIVSIIGICLLTLGILAQIARRKVYR